MEKKVETNNYTSQYFSIWLTGFVDGEGCFSISFNKRSKFKTGVEIRPSFSIAQGAKRIEKTRKKNILENIQTYFQCGFIRKSKIDNMVKYEVRTVKNLHEKIIPHFETYPLLTVKQKDFEMFKKIVSMMRLNKHLNKVYLQEIIELAFTMNPAGKRKYTKKQVLDFIVR